MLDQKTSLTRRAAAMLTVVHCATVVHSQYHVQENALFVWKSVYLRTWSATATSLLWTIWKSNIEEL